MMNRYLAPVGIVCLLSGSVGCTGNTHATDMRELFSVRQIPLPDERSDAAGLWRQEAQELRGFADRHDVEAEVLLQRDEFHDIGLVRQRRDLARELRVAAAQVEQRATEAERAATSRMVQRVPEEVIEGNTRRSVAAAVYGRTDRE